MTNQQSPSEKPDQSFTVPVLGTVRMSYILTMPAQKLKEPCLIKDIKEAIQNNHQKP